MELARRGLTLDDGEANALKEYAFEPERYIIEKLGWTPWRGNDEYPGQCDIIDAYVLALRQMHERRDWELGIKGDAQLQYWQPGDVIKNRFRIEAGHTVGKTKLLSGLVNHFYDCFVPSIVYTYAPTWMQIHDLLWKEIKTDRRGANLPGRILDLELSRSDNHFAKGKASNDAGGKGTERMQGQHGEYLMFVLDEAEGIADFVWGAVDSMASGGIVIVIMVANPRTRSSKFYKQRRLSSVKNYRISCLTHPNVIAGKELVPGAVRRDYVATMIEKHCDVVEAHDDDQHTFTLPFDVQAATDDGEIINFPAGTIFQPNAEFLFRVLGIAPANIADKTLVPVGRYEAATKRVEPASDKRIIRVGADIARYGKDYGTIYVRHGALVWRAAQLWHLDSTEYYQAIKKAILALDAPEGASVHVRIDGGGGFGGGVIDNLKRDLELRRKFRDFKVIEVHFNGTPHDEAAYADLATEMMAQATETLKGVRLHRPPDELEADLTEREYSWVNHKGVSVKKLESKDEFKKPTRLGRSPDDGDGFVLCVAPDHLFHRTESKEAPVNDLPHVMAGKGTPAQGASRPNAAPKRPDGFNTILGTTPRR